MIIPLIAGLRKKTLYKMSQYFPKPYKSFGGDINVKIDLSNYATKDDIKNITHVDTLSFALETNVARVLNTPLYNWLVFLLYHQLHNFFPAT